MVIANDVEFIKAMMDINQWENISFSNRYDWKSTWNRFRNNGLPERIAKGTSLPVESALNHSHPEIAFNLLFELLQPEYIQLNRNGGFGPEIYWTREGESFKAMLLDAISNCTSQEEYEDISFSFNEKKIILTEYDIKPFITQVGKALKIVFDNPKINKQTIKEIKADYTKAKDASYNDQWGVFKMFIGKILNFLEKCSIPVVFVCAIIALVKDVS